MAFFVKKQKDSFDGYVKHFIDHNIKVFFLLLMVALLKVMDFHQLFLTFQMMEQLTPTFGRVIL